MYPFLAEKILYPIGDLALKTSVMKYYRFLEGTQWWPRNDLDDLQNRNLQALVDHAGRNVPYYRDLFNEYAVSPREIRAVGDLHKLPIVTKQDIRDHASDILSEDFDKRRPIASSTGGSTGEPLRFYISKDVASMNWAGLFRGWSWGGYHIGDKRIKFGGSSLIPNKRPTMFEKVRDRIERNLPLSAVSLNEQKYARYVDRIRKYAVRFIYGYPSSLFLFAEYCRNYQVADISFESAFCTAEVLLPQHREAIEKQFHCQVFDTYGSYDGGGQAMECPVHDGFHISVEKTIIEIVDDEGRNLPDGETGRIIVTDLLNYAMPFIRYEVGDIGALSGKTCPCGRSLPLLDTILGRIPDILVFSNGNSLSGAAVPCMMKDFRIRQFQLVQTAEDELCVNVVKDTGYSDIDSNGIISTLGHHTGDGVHLRLNFCYEIPTPPNGKFTFIIAKKNEAPYPEDLSAREK